MGFGTIEFTTISRAQDFTTMKQNEDAKPYADQVHLGQQADRDERHRATTVTDSKNAEWQNKRQDAREKGANEYYGDGGKNRNQNKKEKIDRVAVKGRGSFDMKI